MNSGQRSLSGLLLGIVLIPILASLVACFEVLPVPLGDPDRSRVDPSITGLWLAGEEVWVFEPYDERTWLLTSYSIREKKKCRETGDAGEVEPGATNDPEGEVPPGPEVMEVPEGNATAQLPSGQEAIEEPEVEEVVEEIIEVESTEDDYASHVASLREKGRKCLRGKLGGSVKAWLTDLGGAEFMTWENKGLFSEDTGFDPQDWIAFRVIRDGSDKLHLQLLDPDFEGFDAERVQAKLDKLETAGTGDKRALDSARRAVEKVVRRNADNSDLYYEDDFTVLFRIQPEDYDLFVGSIVPSLD